MLLNCSHQERTTRFGALTKHTNEGVLLLLRKAVETRIETIEKLLQSGAWIHSYLGRSLPVKQKMKTPASKRDYSLKNLEYGGDESS